MGSTSIEVLPTGFFHLRRKKNSAFDAFKTVLSGVYFFRESMISLKTSDGRMTLLTFSSSSQ